MIYRPDIAEEKTSGKIYHSFHYNNISDFFTEQKADQIVEYININIAYNEEHEQALWVCYLLTKEHLNNPVCKRKNYFKTDLNINSKSATSNDYYKSGYDRGHLAPAADMLWSEDAMLESFYMSNISPQKPGFNRGVWKKLEGRTRKLALSEDSIIIITGPIFHNPMGSIGENKVTIPAYYYKILVDISAPNLGAVAFVIPNRNTKLSLDKFAISIDSLERISGLNFMEALPDDLEKQLESICDERLLNTIIQ